MTDQEVTLGRMGAVKVHTPDGLIYITRLPVFGTHVGIYRDPDRNPMAFVELDAADDLP